MNIATMGHELYYCGAVFTVSMAMCCSITMISLPFTASQSALAMAV